MMEATMKEFFGIATLAIAAATFVTALAETKEKPTDSPVSVDRGAEVFHPVRGIDAHTASTSVPGYTVSEVIIVAQAKAKRLVCAAPRGMIMDGHEGSNSIKHNEDHRGQTVKVCEWK